MKDYSCALCPFCKEPVKSNEAMINKTPESCMNAQVKEVCRGKGIAYSGQNGHGFIHVSSLKVK